LSEITGNQPEPQNRSNFSIKTIWRIISSLKLAIALILVLAGLSLIGTFVIQVPEEYTADPQNYLWWLENIAQSQTGGWYPLLRLLGFFNLFHSIWFILAGLMLIINITVCSLNRLSQLKHYLSLKPIIHNRAFFTVSSFSIVMPKTPSADPFISFLKKRKYGGTAISQEGETHIMAAKNRFSHLGIYLIHFSLILFILGAVIGHQWGFQNSSFVVAEGQTKEVGYDTGLALKLDEFQKEVYTDGSPKNYRSRVTLIQNQQIVQTGVIEVNHPFKYEGVRFYQSFYGPAENLHITQNGILIYNGMVALDSTMNNHPYLRPAGLLNLSDQGYIIYLVAPASNINDPTLNSNQIGIEIYNNRSQQALAAAVLDQNFPLIAGDLEITYTGSGLFSGFLVNSDPGVGFIWTGSALLFAGLIMVFFFPRRRLWAALIPNLENRSDLDLYVRWDNSSLNSGDARYIADHFKKVSILK
jgi:cytochrome c biogenesis protein